MEELADAASQTKKAIENVQRPHVANKATLEQQSSTASSMCTSLLECVSLVILLHTAWHNCDLRNFATCHQIVIRFNWMKLGDGGKSVQCTFVCTSYELIGI